MMNWLKNPVILTRLFFVLLTTLSGYWVGRGYTPARGLDGSMMGLFVSLVVLVFEAGTSLVPSKKVLYAAGGLLLGLVASWLIYPSIPPSVFGNDNTLGGTTTARILCNLIFGYLGMILALKHATLFNFNRANLVMSGAGDNAKLLDTSVIVDGRIKELISAQFLQGNFIVPEFVINELQKIADSSDPKRRARGRRGLDMLEQIRDATPRLSIVDNDYPDIKEVDHKLVAMAKDTGADLVTNDFNLQKVAVLHQVRVLNINEISNMLKPSVFVGESLHIAVAKEGKEPTQGIGYLEDGTMVVVEDGRNRIGEELEVNVTSILQTPAGRMIFARPNDNGNNNVTPKPQNNRRLNGRDR